MSNIKKIDTEAAQMQFNGLKLCRNNFQSFVPVLEKKSEHKSFKCLLLLKHRYTVRSTITSGDYDFDSVRFFVFLLILANKR
jgi:hypothetical protein